MPISFDKKNGLFTLTTKNTRYVFGIQNGRYLVHHFYGKKTAKYELFKPYVVSFSPYLKECGNTWSPDIFPQEISFFGSGDFRPAALKIRAANGCCATDFVYKSHDIHSAPKGFGACAGIAGIPHARGDGNTKLLTVVLFDEVTSCELRLHYTVFYEEDVIARSLVLYNYGKEPVKIEKCMPLTLDLPSFDYDMVTLFGGHYDERHYQRVPLHHGTQSVCSRRGASSPQYNPFMALCSGKATEDKGEVYGFNLIWSGSFLDEVEVDQTDCTRVGIGLGEENFGYLLEPTAKGGPTKRGSTPFYSPQAILTYSDRGFGRMTRNLHNFTRNHILPERAVKEPHPVVLNTWEACYFNIDEEKLVNFAEESAKVGFDMLVMDDGWFGARNNDRAGLGDWTPNPAKFKNGLGSFVNKVKSKGIRFGIWIEPEMVNPDSDLYRAHPDWALSVPGRAPSLSREQLVLDMANPEVIDYLKDSFKKAFGGLKIDYFKWDANRHICDAYSHALPPERQDEAHYRYMLGVYELLRWFAEEFPDAQIETCSGGGGRYDLGMMAYGFQIWASDNTWPYSRLWMQRSALLAYPAATMSCHVSNPGEDLRALDFRYKVAVGGMLGYELNILRMTDPVKKEMARQVKEYKTFEHLVRLGDYHSLASPFLCPYSAYYYTDGRHKEFLLSVIEKEGIKPGSTKPLKLAEADPEKTYTDLLSGSRYTGRELKDGIVLPLTGEKFTAALLHLHED